MLVVHRLFLFGLWTAGLLIWGWLFSAIACWMAVKWLQVYGMFPAYCFAMGIFAWLHRWKRGKFLRLQKLHEGWFFHDPSVLKMISTECCLAWQWCSLALIERPKTENWFHTSGKNENKNFNRFSLAFWKLKLFLFIK